MSPSVEEILREARRLLMLGWSPIMCMRREAGFWVVTHAQHPDAERFDVLGALERASRGNMEALADAEQLLSEAVPDGVTSWSCAEGRTQTEVLHLMTRVVARADASRSAEASA